MGFGNLATTPNNGFSISELSIPATLVLAGENTLEFVQNRDGWRWGVTDILIDVSSLLSNGGFESGLADWLSCSESGATQTVADASEGAAAAQLTGGDCLYQELPVAANESYLFACEAKGAQTLYTSVTYAILDASYTSLVSDEQAVTSSSYRPYTSTLVVPGTGAIGVVTLYSDDTGTFDACRVVRQ